ncbi:MAG: glycoside hydrolase family 127 protein, partial [Bacteroidetes bacterium]|nr:glycoside hydrolase family 127 protein [Bacteroidota bacterium]
RLDYMISELKRAQDANGNGYLGGVPGGRETWDEIAAGNIRAGAFSLNDKWVPLYNIHKTYAGLRDAYLYGESQEAREMLVKLTDWMILLVSQLSEEQIQDMLRSEHGGLNETFADVAAITGDEKYLKLAQQFSHQVLLEPLLKEKDILTGMHANTQIPKVIGFERIAELGGDTSWTHAARFFWEQVVENRSVSIGGNSAYEHFHPSDDFSRMIHGTQGPETCNTYNMLRLTKMLLQQSLDKSYIDYYERALYNHILSSQHPETGGLVYFTQMRPGHYRVYSQPQTSFWCCVGSGIENHAKYGELIDAHTDQELYVNLFIPSRLNWREKGVEVVQENKFPEEEATHFTIHTKEETAFTLKIRNPEWVTPSGLRIRINGSNFDDFEANDDFISINRTWKNGDQVDIDLPMHLQSEQLPDGSNYYTFLYGPIVLAAKIGGTDLPGLFADDSRGGHIAPGEILPLKDMPVVVSEPSQALSNIKPVASKPLHFQLSGLYPETYTNGLELIPFYTLHESRYILYFPQADEQGLEAMQAEIEAREEARRKLDAITVDAVSSGQQQPESDHLIQQKDTWTGYDYDEHWREGPGWFSYEMRNTELKAKQLYISYLDIDRARMCEIFINDQKVGELYVDQKREEKLNTLTIEIPQELQKEKALTVKIASADKKWMMKMVGVRLLSL